jgi:hypothetical protein
VRELLERLPDDFSLDDILYHLYVVQAIEKGFADVEAGRTAPTRRFVATSPQMGPRDRAVVRITALHPLGSRYSGARDGRPDDSPSPFGSTPSHLRGRRASSYPGGAHISARM